MTPIFIRLEGTPQVWIAVDAISFFEEIPDENAVDVFIKNGGYEGHRRSNEPMERFVEKLRQVIHGETIYG